jgi:hypothetical protein
VDETGFDVEEALASMQSQMSCWRELRRLRELMNDPIRMGPTLDEFILDHGRAFRLRGVVPDDQVRAESQECYWNAWQLAKDNPSLRYCEGKAYLENVALPVLHGWCIDENDRVIDPSVRQDRGVSYYGVEFSREFAQDMWSRLDPRALIGILCNADVLQLSDEDLVLGVVRHLRDQEVGSPRPPRP